MPDRRTVLRLAIAATLALPGLARAGTCNLPVRVVALRDAVIAEINARRRANGLTKLGRNERLEGAAQGLACDNAARQQISHTASDGTDLRGRLQQAGYRFSAASENVQMGAASPVAAVDAWMASSGHRANILTAGILDIGVGIAASDAPDGPLHWVVNMGAPP